MSEQEYFTVNHALAINVEALEAGADFPCFDQFEREIPAPFLVASEFSHLDLLNDHARSELKTAISNMSLNCSTRRTQSSTYC